MTRQLHIIGQATDRPRRHVLDLDPAGLSAELSAAGEPTYRADQILQWIYRRQVRDFAHMTNLSKSLRERLDRELVVFRGGVVARSTADDGTVKLVLRWPDDATVETVWIPAADRNTVCVSSQVGCPVGCRFCASGLDGVQRNLSIGEIVEQVLRVEHEIAAAVAAGAGVHPRLTNVVMMGMGEPLANYRHVVAALRTINAPWGGHIGARKITVSTVGLPRQIRQLADEAFQFNLALSLHAPDDELRQELIPWGRVPIAELLDACAYYFRKTGREITLEYVLLAGVNDDPARARALARIARQLRANINLLRYNPVAGLPYARPSAEAAYDFQRRLREAGANAHVRTSRGREVDAACGQLRRALESATAGDPSVHPPPLEEN